MPFPEAPWTEEHAGADRQVARPDASVESARHRPEWSSFLVELGGALLGSDHPSELLGPLCGRLASLLGCQSYLCYEAATEGGDLVLGSAGGLGPGQRERFTRIAWGQGLFGSAAAGPRVLLVEDGERTTPDGREALAHLGWDGCICLPLVAHGRPLGLLVFGARGTSLEREALAPLELAAAHIAAALERQRRSDALAASEREHRVIFEAAGLGMARIDRYLRVVRINPRFCQMLGYAPGELVGKPIANITHPEDRARDLEALLRMQRGEDREHQVEKRYLRKDGTLVWARLTVTPIRDEAGAFLGALGVVEDVSERKRVEEALRESEERFRTMAECAPVLIWMSGTDRLCNYFNQRWLEFTGRSMEQELGQGWAEGLHPGDFARCLEVYASAFDARRPFEMEYRLRRADGQYRWIHDAGAPRYTPGGLFLGYIGSCVDVTERRQAEAALRESEERYRAISELTSDYAYELAVTSEGRLTWRWVTAAFMRITGFQPVQWDEQRDWRRIVHPEDAGLIERRIARILGGEPDVSEFRIVTRDGEVRWLRDHARPAEVEPAGRVSRIYGAAQDITEARRTAEDQRLLIELTDELHAFEDGEAMLLHVAERVGAHLGVDRCFFSEVELTARRLVLHHDYHRGLPSIAGAYATSHFSPETMAELREGHTVVNDDAQTDPRTAPYYAAVYEPLGLGAYVAIPLRREGRWAASLMVSTRAPRRWSTRDIALLQTLAERAWLWVEHVRTVRALRASEERFRLAALATNDAIRDWDLETGQVSWNEAVVTLFGHREVLASASSVQAPGQAPSAQPVTTIDWWKEHIHPEDRGWVVAGLEAVLGSQGAHWIAEYRFRRADGSYADVLDRGFMVRDERGRPTRLLGAMLDLTERRRAETEREARMAELARRVHFSELFVGMLGHDLRTPLTAITNSASLLLRRAPSEELVRPAQRVLSSAERMARMITQLLDFTRIRLGGGLPLKRDQVDLREVCQLIVEELAGERAEEVRLSAQGSTEGVWDRDRLSQLLSNLIGNALQHRTPGTPVDVHIDGTGDGELRLLVRNDGHIPPELQPVLFEPLHTTERRPHRGSSGLGLGLYISQQVAIAHGGAIEVHSSAEAGTRFTVRLPRASEATLAT